MFGFIKKAFSIFQSKSTTERKESSKTLEEILYEADFGGTLSKEIITKLNEEGKKNKISSQEDMRTALAEILSSMVLEYKFNPDPNKKNVFLLLGVNGSGKTTTCAKLCKYYNEQGYRTLLSASDTFRAAAGEQLEIHAKRLGVDIIRNDKAGGPAAVIYDAIASLKKTDKNLLICDSAGRMHTKENLLKELGKIDKIVSGSIEKENYKKFLVLDSTTGQNAIAQAESFDKIADIDALILTKVDSGAKAGATLRICSSLNLPVAFVGSGEGYDDIRPFNKDEYIASLLDG